tara:strand:+ start:232 stop:456 length:225 start_codon:yes stop_codon:yes gene_type:complete
MKIMKPTYNKQGKGKPNYPFLNNYIYRLFVAWGEGEILALQTKDSQFCLDKYRRLTEQGHENIRIEFTLMQKVS